MLNEHSKNVIQWLEERFQLHSVKSFLLDFDTFQWKSIRHIINIYHIQTNIKHRPARPTNTYRFQNFVVYTEFRRNSKMYEFWNSETRRVQNFQNIYCVKSVQIRSFFWSVFSCIWTEYGYLTRKSPYSVQMRENTDHKNSVLGQFSCSGSWIRLWPRFFELFVWAIFLKVIR